jgi:hypothetical protein
MALGLVALGMVLAFGPTLPIARPRCATHMLVSKASSIPKISICFIHCPPLATKLAPDYLSMT